MFSRYKKQIIYSVVFGALVYLALSIYARFDELLVAFSKYHWWMSVPVLLLSLLNYLFRYFKWEYYTRVLRIAPDWKTNCLIFQSSFVMSVTPGKLGEVLKSYFLKEVNDTPVSRSAPIVLAERITDFLSLILLSLAGALTFGIGTNLMLILAGLFILFIAIMSSKDLSHTIIEYFERFNFIRNVSHHIHDGYDSVYELVKIKHLFWAILISVFAWFAECLGFYLVIHSFGIENLLHIDIFVATFIYGFATIAGAVTMLPGGLGVTDASMPLLLVKLSESTMSQNIAIAATIITRVATLWFAVLVGIVALLIYQKISHKKLNEIVLES